MLRTAIAKFGLHDVPMQTHPFRKHFLRRELAALDTLLGEIAAEAENEGDGAFCVGGQLSLADLFLVPQVHTSASSAPSTGINRLVGSSRLTARWARAGQVRNALGAGLAVEEDYPAVGRVWRHCIGLPFIR